MQNGQHREHDYSTSILHLEVSCHGGLHRAVQCPTSGGEYTRSSYCAPVLWPCFAISSASVSAWSAGRSDLPAVVCPVTCQYGTVYLGGMFIGHTPPSTGIISPVIHFASLLQRNRIAVRGRSYELKTRQRSMESYHSLHPTLCLLASSSSG